MENKLTDTISTLKAWISYKTFSRHRNGHGIHPPRAFELVNKVLYDKKNYTDYKAIEKQIERLKKETTLLEFQEIGGGSRGLSQTRRVCDMAKVAGVRKKYGRLLYRLVKYYQPKNILELGTSVGPSTMYLASGNKASELITIEGIESCIQVAKDMTDGLELRNVEFRHGLFDDILPDVLPLQHDLVYIDGNHTYEATLNYYMNISSVMSNGFIVFDDINWSAGMQKAWKEIKEHAVSTIDIFQFGIVLVGEKLTPGHWQVRF